MASKRDRLLISIPVEVNGDLSVHLVDWLLRVVVEPDRLGMVGVRWNLVQDKPTASTRNRQVAEFLESDNSMVLFLDSDMVPDDDSINSLLKHIRRPDIDVISGVADRMTKGGPMPVILKYSGKDKKRARIHNEVLERDPEDGPFELVDSGTGSAVLLCKRHALEQIKADGRLWFNDVIEDDPADPRFGRRVIGHDSWFFIQCHELGLRTWVDTEAYIGHMKTNDLSVEAVRLHHLRLAKERLELELRGQSAAMTATTK